MVPIIYSPSNNEEGNCGCNKNEDTSTPPTLAIIPVFDVPAASQDGLKVELTSTSADNIHNF